MSIVVDLMRVYGDSRECRVGASCQVYNAGRGCRRRIASRPRTETAVASMSRRRSSIMRVSTAPRGTRAMQVVMKLPAPRMQESSTAQNTESVCANQQPKKIRAHSARIMEVFQTMFALRKQ